MGFWAELEGLEELRAAFSDCDTIVAAGMAQAIAEGVEAGAAFAKANHPYQDRTGNLTGSIGAEGDTFVASMQYASFVDQGTSRAQPYPFADAAVDLAVEQATETIATRVVADVAARLGADFTVGT